MYFDINTYHLLGAILLQRLLPKNGSRAHFNTMCFLLAGEIMAADANQLQDLRKFLRTGDEESARR